MNDLELLNKIQKMVEHYLYPNCYDTSDIAVKIWIELYEKKRYLSQLYVHNRCIDEIRRMSPTICPLKKLEHICEQAKDNNNPSEIINLLIKSTHLSIDEKRLLYSAFYKDEKVDKVSLENIIAKLRKEAKLIKGVKGEL